MRRPPPGPASSSENSGLGIREQLQKGRDRGRVLDRGQRKGGARPDGRVGVAEGPDQRLPVTLDLGVHQGLEGGALEETVGGSTGVGRG